MERYNVDEYKQVRDDLKELRVCMTSYLGWTMAGSFIGLSTPLALVASSPAMYPIVGIGFLFSASILTGLLGVLFYKFNSHNRYAGYAKLIAQERLSDPQDRPPRHARLWESCLDALRSVETRRTRDLVSRWAEVVRRTTVAGLDADVRTEVWCKAIGRLRSPGVLGSTRWLMACAGTALIAPLYLVAYILPVRPAGSWSFPLRVFRVVTMLIVAFGALGVWMVWHGCSFASCGADIRSTAISLAWTIVLVILALECVFATWLERLHRGQNTVENYCWRFLPFRAEAMRQAFSTGVQYWSIQDPRGKGTAAPEGRSGVRRGENDAVAGAGDTPDESP